MFAVWSNSIPPYSGRSSDHNTFPSLRGSVGRPANCAHVLGQFRKNPVTTPKINYHALVAQRPVTSILADDPRGATLCLQTRGPVPMSLFRPRGGSEPVFRPPAPAPRDRPLAAQPSLWRRCFISATQIWHYASDFGYLLEGIASVVR